MRPAWRLATSALSARPSRSALLVAAVALSAALVGAVACAMASVNRAVEAQIDDQLGRAELRIRPAGRGRTIDAAVLDHARTWPETDRATPRLSAPLSLSLELTGLQPHGDRFLAVTRNIAATALASALDPHPDADAADHRVRLIEGRLPTAPQEIVVDATLASRLTWTYETDRRARGPIPLEPPDLAHLASPAPDIPTATDDPDLAERLNRRLGVRVGDTLRVVRLLRAPVELEVVGIAEAPPLGGRPQASMLLPALAELSGQAGRLTEIEIELAESADPDAVVEARAGELGPRLLLQTTERVTAGLEQNMRSSQLGFVLASALAFLAASFIIMTGLTTGVAEQQRTLAVLRCIGATRRQLAASQLFVGMLVGGTGALAGIPLGIALAWLLVTVFSEQVPGGLALPPVSLALAGAGSAAAGLLGASWPAWRAARTAPLRAMASRSHPVSAAALLRTLAIGAACVAAMIAVVAIPADGQTVFWGYATFGLPAMFVGYFLLSVPVTLLVVAVAARPISAALRLPPGILARTIRATPFRHGFTAGAMMAGLALMVAIWTNGGAMLRDYIERIEFPDAFVSGFALTEDTQAALDALPFITATCAITLHPVETDAFGVRALQRYQTTFVAFEPEPFFRMAGLEFIQGDPEYARRRLAEGGAVIVAREFLVAQGLGAGDTFVCRHAGVEHEFEIVGVVTSPGLELVSKFFNVGDEFIEQALHAVFGSRSDLRERFDSDAIQLIQIALDPAVDDDEAVAAIRRATLGAGVIDAGSGRRIKEQIRQLVGGTLLVFSTVAVGAMLIAGFGVANLVIAGIEARRFEFGVLRAVGAGRALLVRLIVAETVVIAIAACIVGTAMGLQGSWAGQRLYRLLLGLSLELRPPWTAIGVGCLIVGAMTLGAALPAALRLGRTSPRELLASRG